MSRWLRLSHYPLLVDDGEHYPIFIYSSMATYQYQVNPGYHSNLSSTCPVIMSSRSSRPVMSCTICFQPQLRTYNQYIHAKPSFFKRDLLGVIIFGMTVGFPHALITT